MRSPVRVTFSPLRMEDIEHVSRLERRCYTLPWSSSAYATEVGNPNACYLVAKPERVTDRLRRDVGDHG